MDWDAGFVDRSPIFAAVSALAAPLRAYREWPSRHALQRLVAEQGVTTASGAKLHLVAPAAEGESYEARVYRDGAMQLREGEWHDFFNVLAWLAYPRTKSALNHAHYVATLEERANERSTGKTRVPRGRARDALTLFDESGAIVAASDPDLLDDLREFRWKRLFRERRDRVLRSMRIHVFGHALFEKALRPYVGLTAHVVLIAVDADLIAAPLHEQLAELDARVAECVRGLNAPRMLAPLPVLGVPGWWAGNEDSAFYDDERYFRPGRTTGRPER